MKLSSYNAARAVRVCASLVALNLAATAFAQSNPPMLKEVVITATRGESRSDELISDVKVITRDDIEALAGRSLTEVISRAAGVSISSNGGIGKSSNIYIRGMEARHTLLLVDGVRYGSASSGSPNFDTIPLELIDRIEVLKGPASSLYGSDAIGGVVQIFTRRGREGIKPYASLTLGEGDRSEVAGGVSGAEGGLQYSLGAQTLNESGFSATNARASGFNADRDGFNQNSGYGNFQYAVNPGLKLGGVARQADGVNRSDTSGAGTFDTRTEWSTSVFGLDAEVRVLEDWKIKLAYGNSTDKSTYHQKLGTTSRFDTTLGQGSVLNTFSFGWGKLVLGGESYVEALSSSLAYPIKDRNTQSVLAMLDAHLNNHMLQLNARRDRNSQFGSADTGSAGYGYRVTQDLRLKASYATSFKAPTFNALYYPSSYSNPNLSPEFGRNVEVGVTYAMGSQLLSLTSYFNRMQDMIITSTAKVSSVPNAAIRGTTVELGGGSGAWNYQIGLDWLNAYNESTGAKLPRRPHRQLTASTDITLGDWKVGTSLFAASASQDDDVNTVTKELGGYGTVDLYARKSLGQNWSVDGRLINIGDKFYQTAYGYNQPGRAAYITLRYQPQ